MKVAVIGAGATGTSAARFLAAAGHEVHLYDRFALGHTRGSSHGTSRILRCTYDDPHWAALMREAFELWRALEHDAGEQLFVPSGLLSFGADASEWLARARETLRASSVPHEELSAREVGRRFPGLRLMPDEHALFEPGAGWLRADAVLRANLRLACARGAVLHEHARVMLASDGSVDGARFDAIAVCAGPFIRELVPDLPVRVTLQHFAYFEAAHGAALPAWIDASEHFDYGLPDYGRGCKIGRHALGVEIDPEREIAPDPRVIAGLAETARTRLASDGVVKEAFTCRYTNAANEDFLIGRLPCDVPAYFVSGCSGHGFKFTVWLGWLLRELIEGRRMFHFVPGTKSNINAAPRGSASWTSTRHPAL